MEAEAGSGCVGESGELLTWGLRVRGGKDSRDFQTDQDKQLWGEGRG